MESTTHDTPHQSAAKAAEAARHAGAQLSDAAAEKLGQAKQKVGEIYEQVNRGVNDQYNKAVGFGRENPGKTTLIALGVGVGLGLLIGGNVRGSRRNRGRIVEPVIHALSTLATDLFA